METKRDCQWLVVLTLCLLATKKVNPDSPQPTPYNIWLLVQPSIKYPLTLPIWIDNIIKAMN